MKEMQIVPWCDGEHEQRVRATVERTVSIDGKAARVVDLCAAHDKAVEVVEVLAENGVPAPTVKRGRPPGSGRKPMDLPTDCPICGHVAPTRKALTSHARDHHQMRISELDQRREVST